MFKDTYPKEGGAEIETIIGPSVVVAGDFASKGNMTVEGSVSGTLKTERDLRVGENAKIAADVWAANAFVAGEIRGNIKISGKLEMTETSKIYGDMEVQTLIVAPGALLNGKCAMGGGASERAKDDESKTVKK